MISSDERQAEDILRKWFDEKARVSFFGVSAEGEYFSVRGELTSVKDGTFTIDVDGRDVTVDFKGATIKYGEAKESRSDTAKNLAPDAMAFDFILPDGARFGLLEMRRRDEGK